MKTRKFSLTLAVLLLILCSSLIPGVYATWAYFIEAEPRTETVNMSIGKFEYGDIYIIEMDVLEDSSNYASSTIKKRSATTIGGDVVLNASASSSMTLRLTFYNETNSTFTYYGTSDTTYDNTGITYQVVGGKNFVDGKERLVLDVVFSYTNSKVSSNKKLNAVINFLFQKVERISLTVPDGNSADNPASLYDGSTNYNGNDTSKRWTNWTSTTNGRGEPATLNVVWEEEVTFDSLKLFHFVDANRNTNWYGSCDLPESVSIYYYDETAGDYLLLTKYTESKNYTNAKRRASDGVYQMTIGGNTVTFTYSYAGTPPITTYALNNKVTTRAIKVVVDAKANFFVGLMELQVLNGTTNVMRA